MALLVTFEEFKKDLPVVEDGSIYKTGKNFHFSETGLYSEQIFGPLKNYSCACGQVVSKMNAGIRCDKCGVLCDSDKLRNTQFARIDLPVFIILPTLVKNLYNIFGQNPIKSIMDKGQYQTNKDKPYYFLKNHTKLVKIAEKDKEVDNYYIEYPVFDIPSLHQLFNFLRDETTVLDTRIEKKYLDFVFVDYVLVLPVNSRPVVRITAEKSNVHQITEKYAEILKNKRNSITDSLLNINSETFGNTVYKYQYSVDQLYDIILQKNFQQKESVSRDYLMGKIIEHSGRFVIVPNPILKPYQIGLQAHVIKEINKPELTRFIYEKYGMDNENGYSDSIIDYLRDIDRHNTGDSIANIDDNVFKTFLKEYSNKLVYICERPPVLWKYNVTAFFLGMVNWDENDKFRKMIPFNSAMKLLTQTFKDTIKTALFKIDKNKKFNYRKSVKMVSENFSKTI
jgi:DNA-directed RNA polymerase beta' subunit